MESITLAEYINPLQIWKQMEKRLILNESYINNTSETLNMIIKLPAYGGGYFEYSDDLKPGETMTKTQPISKVIIYLNK